MSEPYLGVEIPPGAPSPSPPSLSSSSSSSDRNIPPGTADTCHVLYGLSGSYEAPARTKRATAEIIPTPSSVSTTSSSNHNNNNYDDDESKRSRMGSLLPAPAPASAAGALDAIFSDEENVVDNGVRPPGYSSVQKNFLKWSQCIVGGATVGDSWFVPTKIFSRNPSDGHTLEQFMQTVPGIAFIIDLSLDEDPYPIDPTKGPKYVKLRCVSKKIPSSADVQSFCELVNRFRTERMRVRAATVNGDVPSPPFTRNHNDDDDDHVKMRLQDHQQQQMQIRIQEGEDDFRIVVHCHYGFNRTGFLICQYLIRHAQWTVERAVEAFAVARPPGIKHASFIDELFRCARDMTTEAQANCSSSSSSATT